MLSMTIKHIIWDFRNVTHIARHQVLPEEVDELCSSEKIYFSKAGDEKVRIIGQIHSGRYLAVFLANKGEGTFYVVTARDATANERKLLKRKS